MPHGWKSLKFRIRFHTEHQFWPYMRENYQVRNLYLNSSPVNNSILSQVDTVVNITVVEAVGEETENNRQEWRYSSGEVVNQMPVKISAIFVQEKS